VLHTGDVRLPEPGPGSRLRGELHQPHGALNERRQEVHAGPVEGSVVTAGEASAGRSRTVS
jgi:hypothetical protein